MDKQDIRVHVMSYYMHDAPSVCAQAKVTVPGHIDELRGGSLD